MLAFQFIAVIGDVVFVFQKAHASTAHAIHRFYDAWKAHLLNAQVTEFIRRQYACFRGLKRVICRELSEIVFRVDEIDTLGWRRSNFDKRLEPVTVARKQLGVPEAWDQYIWPVVFRRVFADSFFKCIEGSFRLTLEMGMGERVFGVFGE